MKKSSDIIVARTKIKLLPYEKNFFKKGLSFY